MYGLLLSSGSGSLLSWVIMINAESTSLKGEINKEFTSGYQTRPYILLYWHGTLQWAGTNKPPTLFARPFVPTFGFHDEMGAWECDELESESPWGHAPMCTCQFINGQSCCVLICVKKKLFLICDSCRKNRKILYFYSYSQNWEKPTLCLLWAPFYRIPKNIYKNISYLFRP